MNIQCTGCGAFFDVENYDYPIYCPKCQDYGEWEEEGRDLSADIKDLDDHELPF